jgi:hypothetical protein
MLEIRTIGVHHSIPNLLIYAILHQLPTTNLLAITITALGITMVTIPKFLFITEVTKPKFLDITANPLLHGTKNLKIVRDILVIIIIGSITLLLTPGEFIRIITGIEPLWRGYRTQKTMLDAELT